MPDRLGSGPTLFRQIARRLIGFTLIFALLDVGIVIFTYTRQPESLVQELLTLEAERVAALPDPAAAQPPPGIANWSAARVTPRHSGNAMLIDWTRRERIAGGYRISGVRLIEDGDTPRWMFLAFDTIGIRPFVPVVLRELREHVLVPLVPLSLLLLLFNVVSVRRMLSPLHRAEAEVDALDPANMAMRLSLPLEPREVNALVRAVNRALARLEAAVITLRDFTANAAHELRTPLAIMQLSIDRLPDGPAKADLMGDTERMTRLVSQMLDLAQADALVVDALAPVDLAAIGRAVVAQLAPKGFSIGRDLRFVDHGGALAHGHAEALFRVYRNLVDNAFAHARGDTPIDVAAGPGPQFSVRDHGPGIAAADLPHLFERFWRKDRSDNQGAGLGLGIARRLVEAHGGSISVELPADGGACFRVRLPVARETAD